MDDILIFSDTMEEHWVHVWQVFEALKANGLHLKLEKCKFYQQEVEYLGLIIGKDGVRMDPRKVQAVTEWTVLQGVRDV